MESWLFNSEKMKINEKFKNLIPPLTSEEFLQLENNCKKDGILESIKTWQGYIIDGHNRYEIAIKNNLLYQTKEMYFDSEPEVVEWIILHQFGRRNLTESQKSYLRGVRYENEKLKHGGERSKLQILQLEKTSEKLANEYNVSERTIINDANFSKGIDVITKVAPEKRDALLNEKTEFTKAEIQSFAPIQKQAEQFVKANVILKTDTEIYSEIEKKANELALQKIKEIEEGKQQKKEEKIQQRQESIQQTKEKINKENITIKDKYDVVVIDPPWAYEERGGFSGKQHDPDNLRGGVPYPTMTLQQIQNIEIPIKENAILFLWTTHAFLHDAFHLLEKWGLTYKATMVWDKEIIGMGRNIRMQCEFCLIATKGKPIINGNSERDIIREKRRQHSRKPDAFYDFVERYTYGSKLDYFSRETRNGWAVFGAETNKF